LQLSSDGTCKTVSNESLWPTTKDDNVPVADRAKVVFDAKVAAASENLKAHLQRETDDLKAQRDETSAYRAAEAQGDIANLQAFFNTMSSLAVGAVDRARGGAELVQKAAASVATVYTGILALVFSVTNNPLPARALLAPIFLGTAVALSTAYIAYLSPSNTLVEVDIPEGFEPIVYARLQAIIDTTTKLVKRRSPLLRASVFALGVGLFSIVMPFVTLPLVSTTEPPVIASSPDWPSPASVKDPEFSKTLYAARVKEVADARAFSVRRARNNDGSILVIGLAVGSAVIGLSWLVGRDRNK
jgi:hypothetical protein